MTTGPWSGAGGLARLALATERRWVLGALVVFAATYVATATQIRQIAATPSERRGLQATIGETPAFRVLLGPFDHPETVGGTTLWRVGVFMLAVVAVLVATVVVRVTRRSEELGQAELLGATATGRLAPLGAGLVAGGLTVLAAAVGTAVGLGAGSDAPVTDAVAAGAQVVVVGVVALGLALVCAQVAEAARTALALVIAAVLVAYAVRGAADVRDVDTVAWLTPFGWAERVDPFGTIDVLPVALALVAAALLVLVAVVLRGRRDLGAGLIAPRPGPARAPRLRHPVAMTLRLEQRSAVFWVVGVIGFGVFVGSLVPTIRDLGDVNGALADALRRLGGPGALLDVFVSAMASISGLVVASWGVAVVTRVHADESAGRLEQVLATGTSRRAVLLAPTLVALAGVVPALALVGVAIGFSGGDLGDAVPAALVQAPAVAVVIAVAALGQALGGRWSMLAWGGVVVATAVGQVGAAVGMPEWLQQASPFTHVPEVPADSFALAPEVGLLVVAAAVVAAAVVAVGRRDVPR